MAVTSLLLYLSLVHIVNSASISPLIYNNFIENNNGKCIDELVQSIILALEDIKFAFTINLELNRSIPVIKWDIGKPFDWNGFLQVSLYVIKIVGGELEEILKMLERENCLYPRAIFIIVSKGVNVQIFETLAKYYLASALVVADGEQIFTYNPYIYENVNDPYLEYSKNSCRDIEDVVKRFINTVNYPRKWRNSTIDTLYFPVAPYVFPCRNCTDFTNMSGAEIEIYKIIKNRVGFKVNFIQYVGDEWGPKVNGEYKEGLGLLQKRQVHTMIGTCNAHREEHIDFDITTSYYIDSCRWIVPRIKASISLISFIQVFGQRLWLLNLCSLASVTIFLFIKIGKFAKGLSAVFQVMIESTVYNFHNAFRSVRFSLIIFTLCVLVISTIFKNQMFVTLSSQKLRNSIETFDDLLQSDIRIMLSDRMEKVLEKSSDPQEIQAYKKLYPTPNWRHVSLINAVAFTKDSATVSIRSLLLFILTVGYIDKEGYPLFHILDKPSYPLIIQMFFVKGYPIKEEIDRHLLYCVDSGLTTKQQRDMEYDLNRDIYRREIYVFGAQKLGFDGLKWYFYILGGGLLFSTLTFLAEIIIQKFSAK